MVLHRTTGHEPSDQRRVFRVRHPYATRARLERDFADCADDLAH